MQTTAAIHAADDCDLLTAGVQKNGEVEAQPDKPVAKTATNATSVSSSAPSQVQLHA